MFYHLRVSREDFGTVKRQQLTARAKRAADAAKATPSLPPADGATIEDGPKSDDKDAKDESHINGNGATSSEAPGSGTMAPPAVQPPSPRQPWELVEEIMNILKTAFPLLALTMEKMVDQISIRAKPSSDEDIYRFFAALLNDALLVSLSCVLNSEC